MLVLAIIIFLAVPFIIMAVEDKFNRPTAKRIKTLSDIANKKDNNAMLNAFRDSPNPQYSEQRQGSATDDIDLLLEDVENLRGDSAKMAHKQSHTAKESTRLYTDQDGFATTTHPEQTIGEIGELVEKHMDILTKSLDTISVWAEHLTSEEQEQKIKTAVVINYISLAIVQAGLAAEKYARTPAHFFYFSQVFRDELIKGALDLDIAEGNPTLTLKLLSYGKLDNDPEFYVKEFTAADGVVESVKNNLTESLAISAAESFTETIEESQTEIANSIFLTFLLISKGINKK